MAGVFGLVDQPAIIQVLQDHADDLHVPFFGGTDEIAVFDPEFLPEFLEADHGLIAVFQRGHIAFGGRLFDFLTVFVGAGQEVGIFPEQRMETGQDIRQHGRVGVTDMRLVIHIIDRSRDIITFGHDEGSFQFISGRRCGGPCPW